jgi:hypothetical protein
MGRSQPRVIEAQQAPDGGALLALLDVTVDPPRHQVAAGQVWALGPHTLAVADVITGWPTWLPYLQGEALFVPHPGPYAPLSRAAGLRPLVLCQPNLHLAGWLLDTYASVHGPDSVHLVTPTP